ncbi:MAG: DinB family protein [Fimbriimonadaceae bacterium]|nr:DinB family protein [Fimbriimonadaceae bacterium]
MDVPSVLKGQYHASLAMLRQTIERCPDALWTEGAERRGFWRIVYHTLFFTDLYLQPKESDFRPWPNHRADAPDLGDEGPPAVCDPYTKKELLDYLADLDARIDAGVDRLDLETADCGFYWYDIPKLDHQVMNVRHVQQHVGQLTERLFAAGVDLDWMGKR